MLYSGVCGNGSYRFLMPEPLTVPNKDVSDLFQTRVDALRVLLIDSCDEDATYAQQCLQTQAIGELFLMRVNSATAARTALSEQKFDVMIVECENGTSDIVSAVTEVRSLTPSTPVIVYTRSIDDSTALLALRAGAQECLVKSETPPHVLARVVRYAIERQRRIATIEAARVEAAHKATHDPLTGLANRDLFLDHLERALALGARYGKKTGLLFVDLDGFKAINDTLGHKAGDIMLQQVASRLLECVRKSDAVARLGGDEFVVLLPDVTSRRDLGHVRNTIIECLAAPVDLGNEKEVGILASVGSAMSPLDGTCAQALLDAADADMYRTKYDRRRGRMLTPAASGMQLPNERVAPRDASDHSVPRRRESRLSHAVATDQFEVHYQPVIDVVARKLTGAEALLRWRDPERGLISPATFLPLAEDTGLIVPIGEYVLKQACETIVKWRQMATRQQLSGCAFTHVTPASLRVSVNISAVQLREREFDRRVAAILDETGCSPDALVFELTESSTMVDGSVMIESLRAIKKLGIQLVVDDFGVGFASLTFLREAPIDGIKIDRRFVTNMLYDRRDASIVSSLVRLARGLSLRVTGEGVEGIEQSQRLARLQCFEQQGRYFSDAIPESDFASLLSRVADETVDDGSFAQNWMMA